MQMGVTAGSTGHGVWRLTNPAELVAHRVRGLSARLGRLRKDHDSAVLTPSAEPMATSRSTTSPRRQWTAGGTRAAAFLASLACSLAVLER